MKHTINHKAALKVLREVKDLLKGEGTLSRFAEAQDAEGNNVSWNDVNAVKWSTGGAILKICNGDATLNDMVRKAIVMHIGTTVGYFNNTHDVREIQEMLTNVYDNVLRSYLHYPAAKEVNGQPFTV